VKAARETGKILTVEENYLRGGLGSLVCQVVSEEYPVPIRMIGIDDTFVGTGPYEDLLAKFGLQPEQIAETAIAFLRK
jgi:transketolase